MSYFLLLGLPWIGLGMAIGFICLIAVNNDPFENLQEEIETGIKKIEL